MTQNSDLPTLLSQNPSNSSLNAFSIQRSTISMIAEPSTGTIPDTIPGIIAGTTMPVDDVEVVVLDTWPSAECEARRIPQIRRSKRSISTPVSPIENPPQISPSRPKRRPNHRSMYEGELIQPRKCSRHCNWEDWRR